MDTLLTERLGPIARLTLNDPGTLNALDSGLLKALADAVSAADADPGVRAITITGAGRGFCSGARLASADEVDTATLDGVGRALRAITGSGTPVIAGVNGVAAGAGMSLALACDYVLASETAFFTLAFGRIALMPDGGATSLVAASIGRARAMRLALTAERLSAASALEWGLIAEVSADLESRLAAVESELAGLAPLAVAATKQAINAASMEAVDAVLEREEAGQTRLLATQDFREGVAAFGAKRRPEFKGL